MSTFQVTLLSVGVVLVTIGVVQSRSDGRVALSPILIVPGINGSRLNVMDTTDTNCSTNGETITIFVNFSYIRDYADCFATQLELNYSSTGYRDAEGVNVTAANFGSTSSVETLDLEDTDLYFFQFVDYFVQRGYKRDVNIRAAPYDYRLGSKQLEERMYFRKLQQLVETMYAENGNTSVTITAFSFGAQISLYFLNKIVSQEWKDTYIHSFVTLGGSWYGGVSIIFTLLTGPLAPEFLETQIGIPRVVSLYRNYPSFYYTLPRASIWRDTVLIRSANRNYTANEYEELFADAGFPEGYSQFVDSDSGIDLSAPKVPTYCFYGSGIPTPATFIYGNGFNMGPTNFMTGDGDGRINQQDLEICRQWDGMNAGYTFSSTAFSGVNHPGSIRNEAILQRVESIVITQISGAVSPMPTQSLLFYQIAVFVSVMSFVKTIF